MSQFLNRVRDVDPNDSDAVKDALSAFFQNLPKHRDNDCNRWLRALENIINRFPKYCGQHRGTIENYLCHFLDSNNYFNVIEAAKCAHAVQQVRPVQDRTAAAKLCWRDQMTALCDAAQSLINTIFTNSAGIYNRNGDKQKSDSQMSCSLLQEYLADIVSVSNTTDVLEKTSILCTRLRNVLVFIQAMLVEMYPVAKPVRPQLILEVILQALSAPGNEDSVRVTMIKVQALRTLDAVVACLGSNLIPFSALIFRFVMQTLRWSSEFSSQESRQVRCVAYSSLTSWLQTLLVHRAGERARAWDTDLAAHVVRDVTPPKHVVQLTPNAQPMKNLSKRARKKLANSLLMQSNIATHMPGEKNKANANDESNDDLAIAALECAEAFLTTCGLFLKQTTHKTLQELLVRECFALDVYSESRAIWLLRALEASRKGSSPKVPPPTQYCLQLYSDLVNAKQHEISKFASQALLDIRLHLHCAPPSLNFAIEEQPQKKPQDRKRISDRNRAALENLLGKDRMPPEDPVADEIITIADEPANKKSRIDEDTSDKISLSSESNASIEITDGSSVEEVDNDSTDYIIEPINNFEVQENIDAQVDETAKESEEITDVNDKVDGICDDDVETVILSQNEPDEVENQGNIHEMRTQLPPQFEADESSTVLSSEVVYDFPSTGQDKVKVLEKMDEDNLPSTNDTDDIHITCGQDVKSSQEVDSGNKEMEVSNELPMENGVDKSPEKVLENGDVNTEIQNELNAVTAKVVSKDGEITVEDMLADFVDEVNEGSQTPVQT